MAEPYKPLYTVKETGEVLKVNKWGCLRAH